MHGAGFPRFVVSPFGVLICMHLSDQDATDHENQRSQNRFGLLLSTEVDAEGTHRAKWFANDDQLKATPLRNLSVSPAHPPLNRVARLPTLPSTVSRAPRAPVSSFRRP